MKTLSDLVAQEEQEEKKPVYLPILPESLKKDINIYALSEAIKPLFSELLSKAKLGAIFANLDKLSSDVLDPSDVLDHIALQLAVNPWRDSWDISLKRSAIKASPEIKRKKGTMYAIECALNALGSTTTRIVEWNNQIPQGTPGTFKIYVTEFPGASTSQEAQEDIRIAIDNAKPASRHYDLIIESTYNGNMHAFMALRPVIFAKL